MKIYVVCLNDGMIKGYTNEQKAIDKIKELKESIPKDKYGAEDGCYFYRYEELEVDEN
jgi:hypothetical protein